MFHFSFLTGYYFFWGIIHFIKIFFLIDINQNSIFVILFERILFLKLLTKIQAGVAQLVERNLAKVDVAGSSPVSRSFVNPLF